MITHSKKASYIGKKNIQAPYMIAQTVMYNIF